MKFFMFSFVFVWSFFCYAGTTSDFCSQPTSYPIHSCQFDTDGSLRSIMNPDFLPTRVSPDCNLETLNDLIGLYGYLFSSEARFSEISFSRGQIIEFSSMRVCTFPQTVNGISVYDGTVRFGIGKDGLISFFINEAFLWQYINSKCKSYDQRD